MAYGRIINSKIVLNKIIAKVMEDDTERLAWTWLITFGDAYGRHIAEPDVVRSLLFPYRSTTEKPTNADIAAYLDRWEQHGLIKRYQEDGTAYLQYPKWRANQPGLQGIKEKGRFPPPEGVDDTVYPLSWDGSLDNVGDPEGPHARVALEWYKRYSKVTARLVQPGHQDYLAARDLVQRCQEDDILKAMDFYFKPDLHFWWAKDKKERRTFNFKGFCTNIATILSDMAIPEDKQPVPRHCTYCGMKRLPTSKGPCPRCGTPDGADRPPKKTTDESEQDKEAQF